LKSILTDLRNKSPGGDWEQLAGYALKIKKEIRMKLKVNDIVEFGGLLGIVTDTKSYNKDYPIVVEFYKKKYGSYTEICTKDGKLYLEHETPLFNYIGEL